MTTTEQAGTTTTTATGFLWLEVTGRCQLECAHCYAGSGPYGDHGVMTPRDWRRVLEEAAAAGVGAVQFIGGEPTLYPHLVELVEHALDLGLEVEVYSNLVHVTDSHWRVFSRAGVSLATSYYSDDRVQHAAVTGRDTHRQTRANIARAQALGIPLRAGVIDLGAGQRVEQARADLVDLGVPRIGYDRLRELGRGAGPAAAGCGDGGGVSAAQLCGGCGDGVAAVGADGRVTPCPMARTATVGSVLGGQGGLAGSMAAMPAARRALAAAGMPVRAGAGVLPCGPDGENCYPIHCHPRT